MNQFEDLKIKVVSGFADLDIEKVDLNANQCGKWQIVVDLLNLKVKIVNTGGDIRVRFVDELVSK